MSMDLFEGGRCAWESSDLFWQFACSRWRSHAVCRIWIRQISRCAQRNVCFFLLCCCLLLFVVVCCCLLLLLFVVVVVVCCRCLLCVFVCVVLMIIVLFQQVQFQFTHKRVVRCFSASDKFGSSSSHQFQRLVLGRLRVALWRISR